MFCLLHLISPPRSRRISSGRNSSLNPTKNKFSFDPRCPTQSRLPAAPAAPYASKSRYGLGVTPARLVSSYYLRRREVTDLSTSSQAGQSKMVSGQLMSRCSRLRGHHLPGGAPPNLPQRSAMRQPQVLTAPTGRQSGCVFVMLLSTNCS